METASRVTAKNEGILIREFMVSFCSFLLVLAGVTGPILEASASDNNAVVVAYGGVFLSGGKISEDRHPLFKRNKTELSKRLTHVMERLNERGLPFELLFETDTEKTKMEIEGPYSLAIIITRDDVISEKFTTPTGELFKSYINAGLVVIIYKTDKDMDGQKRNTIFYSVPLVGYSKHIKAQKQPNEGETDRLFMDTAAKTLENYLAQRLSRLSVKDIEGAVRDVKDRRAIINVGSLAGLEKGQNVNFMKDGSRVASGVVEKVDRTEATIEIQNGGQIEKRMAVRAGNMRDQSPETYQVVRFRISSKKARGIFFEEHLGPQVAQWFSDSLADEAGKVVLPTRVGGEWDESATGESFILLTKNDEEYRFSLPPPKYPVMLELTGVTSKKIEGNNVNEIWMHKVWIKVDIPQKNFSKEFDLYTTKNVVPGNHSYEEKDEFFELIHQLSEKICKEGKL